MPLNPLNHHYSMENPASVYDEEAMTALELAGRTAYKVNEVVKAFNQLKGEVPGMVSEKVVEHIQNGEFDQAIALYMGDLEKRVDNLLSSYVPGGTTMDAEIVDMRVGPDGTQYATAGEALRHYLNLGGLVEDTNYQTKMPDANAVRTPSAYILHFATGSTKIPANLPFKAWYGRIATLITLPGTYYRQVLITDNAVYTRNAGGSGNWSAWRTLGKPTYIIDVNGGGDFASILKALTAYNTNARFIIKKGVYNIVQEYQNVYGPNYFEDYAGYKGSADVMSRGLFLGDGVELIGEGRVELVFTYTGTNTAVKQQFSVLNTSQNNRVENVDITIADGSCRYLIHDDFATDGGTNVFKNVTCTGHSYLGTAIGGGFGIANAYVIEDCSFKNPQQGIAIAYHNNANDGKNKLSITGCDCEGSIYIKHYGVSVQKSLAEVSNCKATKIVLAHGDPATYPNENIKLSVWNNELGYPEYTTPEMYGAVGDGATDDSSAFQSAIDSGAYIRLQNKTYRVSNVRIDTATHMDMAGAVIRRATPGGNIFNVTAPLNLENGTLDGMNNSSGYSHVLMFNSAESDLILTNMEFINNCCGYPTPELSVNADLVDVQYVNRLIVTNCVFDVASRNGISVTEKYNEVSIDRCKFTNCYLFGFDCEINNPVADSCGDIKITNSVFIGNGRKNGSYVWNSGGSVQVSAPTKQNVVFGKNVTVSGCTMLTNDYAKVSGQVAPYICIEGVADVWFTNNHVTSHERILICRWAEGYQANTAHVQGNTFDIHPNAVATCIPYVQAVKYAFVTDNLLGAGNLSCTAENKVEANNIDVWSLEG